MSAPPKRKRLAGGRGVGPVLRIAWSKPVYQKRTNTANASDAKRVIQITREAFGCGYDVCIIPPVEPSLDQEFATYKQARGYGGGLRLVQGWHLVDLTGEASNG